MRRNLFYGPNFQDKNNGAVDDKYFVLECGNTDRGRQAQYTGRKCQTKIIELILENNIDIVILAEYTFDMKLMCDMLSVNGKDFKTAPVPEDSRAKMLVSMKFNVELIRDSKYYFICSINNALTDFFDCGVTFFQVSDMLKTETGKLWQNSLWMHCVRHKVKRNIKRLS